MADPHNFVSIILQFALKIVPLIRTITINCLFVVRVENLARIEHCATTEEGQKLHARAGEKTEVILFYETYQYKSIGFSYKLIELFRVSGRVCPSSPR